MLRNVNDLNGFKLVATDGEIGDVERFYFDDEQWVLRYIVVNTGNWLAGRQVLVEPFAVMQVDRDNSKLHVTLTRNQVEKSPHIDTHQPVSRRMDAAYADYYGYHYYWGGPHLWGAVERPDLAAHQSATTAPAVTRCLTTAVTAVTGRAISADVHLRNTKEVASYHIAATDGEIGHVVDFIMEDDSWTIRYLVIDTRKWWRGKKVIISPQWIAALDWAQAKVHVNLSREGIKQSPEYDSSKLISREYESQLYRHHGQTGYWLN